MRGSIRQKGKNSWQLQVYTGPGPDGKPQRHFETVRGRKGDAQRRLTEILSSLDNGTYMRPSKTTLGEYLEKWLNAYAMPNLSPRGYERYRDIIRAHFKPAIGNLLLNRLQPEHLQSCYVNWLKHGLSAGTIRYHHAVIHKALQDAVEWRLLVRNVADAVKPPPKQRPDMQTWSEYELTCFLDAAKNGGGAIDQEKLLRETLIKMVRDSTPVVALAAQQNVIERGIPRLLQAFEKKGSGFVQKEDPAVVIGVFLLAFLEENLGDKFDEALRRYQEIKGGKGR